MPGQVSASVKKQRSNSMLALAEKSAVSFRARFTGTTRPVLWEQRTSGSVWNGLTDNYIRVWTKSNEELGNRVVGHRLKDGAGQDAGSA
jgi:threonylcarbamoyladenosine tRNA methylthiotransferase MtaB